MAQMFISLGANCGERVLSVERASEELSALFIVAAVSDIYETPDINEGPRPYMNAVLRCETNLSAEEVEAIAKEMERRYGRDEAARMRGDVPLDIDVVVCDGKILRQRDFNATFFQKGYRELASV